MAATRLRGVERRVGRVEAVASGERRAAPGERDLEDGVGFLRGGARPPTAVIVDYIDAHRDEFGVEPICRVLTARLQIAPSTLLRRQDPAAVGAGGRATPC